MSKIIAHRGANKLAPQNTLAAFRKATEYDIDGFEMDVHLSKDGKIVVCHNYEIDETSNGKGSIKDMTFEELRSYDFGGYFSEEFAGEKIPALEEFLEIAKGYDTVNIEVKTPPEKNDLVKKTIECVRKFGMEKQVILSCFTKECMVESKELAPEIRTGFLYDMRSKEVMEVMTDPAAFCKKYNLDALHPLVMLVSEEFVKKCQDGNIDLNVWTVNDPDAAATLSEWGITSLITDVPEVLCR